MAAGLTRRQIYDRIRRMQLKNVKRLRIAGVPFVFKKNQISFYDELDIGGGFCIYYTAGNASNGESIITCKVMIDPPRRVPSEMCGVLGIEAKHDAGMNIIEKWFSMKCKVTELQPGDYFACSNHPTNPGTSFLVEEENGERRITRLHDGVYVTDFFKGYIAFVWRILKDKAYEYAVNYQKKVA
jgi:hypothetical protein